MAYQLSVHPNPAYLHVQVTGENTTKTVTDYLHEIGALCDEKKYSTVLIEENLQGPGLNMFEIVKVMKSLRNAPRQLRWIVYVDTNPAHDPMMMDFARQLAIRRGLWVRICHSVQEAEDWIRTMIP